MNAAVEPVFAMLQGMRTDIDPRVRGEVEQTLARFGQNKAAIVPHFRLQEWFALRLPRRTHPHGRYPGVES